MSSKSLMRFLSRYSCWSSLRCRTILVLWPNALPLVRKRAPFDCRPVSLGTSTLENESQVCLCSVCWAGALCGFGRKGHGPRPRRSGPRSPLGPGSTHAVQQHSVVHRAWGPGGVAIFLNRPASTPPRILIGVFLIPPVRCKPVMNLRDALQLPNGMQSGI